MNLDASSLFGASGMGSLVFDSRQAQRQVLRLAFERAAREACRQLWVCDPDFSDWPLGESDVLVHLSRWAASNGTFTVLAGSYDNLARCHPRWVSWRRQWAHRVRCVTLCEGLLPSMLVASGLGSVVRLHADHPRFRVSGLTEETALAKDQLDALLQQSSEAFPASVLGL